MSTDCEVLVVGAGPTGLLAANLLKRSSVDVRIVEKRVAPSSESRAFAVQARTLELMQAIGLDQALLARGVIANRIAIHVRGGERGGLNLDRAQAHDTPFPFILMIPQSQTEAVLIEDLARLGVTVERGVDVTAIEQSAEGVVTSLNMDAGSRADRITSRFVIGADGSHSIVRAEAGLDFAGGTYAQSFLLADCRVDWPHDHQTFRIFVDRGLIGLFLPLEGQRVSRVMTNDPRQRDGDGKALADIDLAEIEATFAKATGLPVKLADPRWVTTYRAHHRGVETYRNGRIFVAGDAAHIHSPAGGQGMNTGLQDVANLAWRLALTLRGQGDDELLDGYDHERSAVGRMVVHSTGRLFKAFAGLGGWRASLRDRVLMTLLPIVSRLGKFHRKGFLNASERAIAYPQSSFVAEGPSWPRGGPRAGMRVPDVAINDRLRLHALIAGYRFHLIALVRSALSPMEAGRISSDLDSIAALLPGCQAHLLARVHHGFDPSAVFVSRADVFDVLGISGDQGEEGGIYLVRPDGYVAFRMSGLDLEPLRQFVEDFAGDCANWSEQPVLERANG